MQLSLKSTHPAVATRHTNVRPALKLCAVTTQYASPSSSTAQSELQWLQRHTVCVPDVPEGKSSAASVTFRLLRGLATSERLGLSQLENAMTAARTFNRSPEVQMDRALVNVGTILASQVEGRVSTEVDPRMSHDKGAMVAKAKSLAAMYQEAKVPASRLLFRLPATWEGCCAAKELEAASLATQLVMVYSLIQGVAAAQAGASLINPRVGQTRDWFLKHPGVIRDPKGPRQDAGVGGGVDPGISLVTQLYNYCKVHHPKTKIMASSIRSREDALALSGCDFLLLTSKVMSALDSVPTIAGYNTGLNTATLDDGSDSLQPQLSREKALEAAPEAMPPVTESSFKEGLGYAGTELLAASLADAVKDVDALGAMSRATTGLTST